MYGKDIPQKYGKQKNNEDNLRADPDKPRQMVKFQVLCGEYYDYCLWDHGTAEFGR
jgi:hypothetical protein